MAATRLAERRSRVPHPGARRARLRPGALCAKSHRALDVPGVGRVAVLVQRLGRQRVGADRDMTETFDGTTVADAVEVDATPHIATSSSKDRSASARRVSRDGWRAASAASWCSSRPTRIRSSSASIAIRALPRSRRSCTSCSSARANCRTCASTTCSRPCASPITCSTRTACSRG